MHQEGVTEAEARKYLWNLMDETWKQLNTAARVESSLPPDFIDLILNTTKMTHALYQYGDGYGHPGSPIKQEFSGMIFDSVPI
ncbi:alpha-farnesene synthase [Ranunculus cassubicifolius]